MQEGNVTVGHVRSLARIIILAAIIGTATRCELPVGTAASAPPPPYGATEPVYQAGVSQSLIFQSFEQYATWANFVADPTWGAYSSSTQSTVSLQTGSAPDGIKYIRMPMSSKGPQYEINLASPLAYSGNGTPGPDVIVLQWYMRNAGTTLFVGKIFKIVPMPESAGRNMFEVADWASGYQTGAYALPSYSCFWNSDGSSKGSGPTNHEPLYLGLYHDGNGTDNYEFVQNTNWGTASGRWKIENLLDQQWHRFTYKLSKGDKAKGYGYQRLEVWADGIKVMDYIGDDPARCEYGKVPIQYPTANLIWLTEIDALTWFAWAGGADLDYDAVRIWVP